MNAHSQHKSTNHDPAEIARFDNIAQHWWDEQGEFQPLHIMNPVRVDYIDQHTQLTGKRVLDVGCGGGLLCETMAKRGAQVTGIDLGETTIEVATLHALDAGLDIRYLRQAVEEQATTHADSYDIITCLEMLEHVPDPAAIISSIATLLKPGGHAVFSTLNRNPKSYAMAVLGAEYLLKLLPKGTHTYAQFIRPAELSRWVRAAGLELHDITGLQFHPLSRTCTLGKDVDVNYLMHVSKPI
ncbi:MAG: bifunctional 2-polyprenyl-6-hydroxyphenol methylase/3-demethylubiquinol 3-O-methyltransferase UbiG [Steroidobacteraceae bacterium]